MIDKVTFAVRDMDAMVRFYTALLDIEFHPIEMHGRLLMGAHFHDIEVLFCPKDLAGVDAEINTIQLRLRVPAIEAAFEAGSRAGGQALAQPAEIEGVQLAGMRDPDGNSLELVQED